VIHLKPRHNSIKFIWVLLRTTQPQALD